MPLPRLSIRAILFVVLLVAADLTAFRIVVSGYATPGLVVGVFGILPVSNLLAIVAYRNLSRTSMGRPFFVGFASSGVLAILVYFYLCLTVDDRRLMSFMLWVARAVEDLRLVKYLGSNLSSGTSRLSYHHAVKLLSFAALTTFPMVILALFGGWIARSFRGFVGNGEV
jgi:hypothetical protein